MWLFLAMIILKDPCYILASPVQWLQAVKLVSNKFFPKNNLIVNSQKTIISNPNAIQPQFTRLHKFSGVRHHWKCPFMICAKLYMYACLWEEIRDSIKLTHTCNISKCPHSLLCHMSLRWWKKLNKRSQGALLHNSSCLFWCTRGNISQSPGCFKL